MAGQVWVLVLFKLTLYWKWPFQSNGEAQAVCLNKGDRGCKSPPYRHQCTAQTDGSQQELVGKDITGTLAVTGKPLTGPQKVKACIHLCSKWGKKASLPRLTSDSYFQSRGQKGPRTMAGTLGMGSHLCTGWG